MFARNTRYRLMSSGRLPNRPVDLAVLIAYTGDGGVERMMNHLLRGFVDAGISVDLLLLKARGGHVRAIPAGVNIIPLDVATSVFATPALYRYLRQTRPRAMLAAKDRAGRVALLARRCAGTDTRVVLRMGMHLSGSLAGKTRIQRVARFLPVRWLYPWADAIITVAQPIADDLAEIGHIAIDRFRVIPNPSLGPDIDTLAAAPLDHPWFTDGGRVPVILAAGRLKPQKDFPTLLHAFSILRQERQARLVILGDGPEHSALSKLARELGIAMDVDLPGFRENPYPWMRGANLVVLSSRYEGSPNVLVEAMWLGTPVVATDCPSGPREILQGGKYGMLVPVGDRRALAAAMIKTLDADIQPDSLQHAVEHFNVKNSSREYLRVLGLSTFSK